MAWQTIVEGSTAQELEAAVPAISDLPAGTPLVIHIELQAWMPVAGLANLAGMEWWAERLSSHVRVKDVSSLDAHTIEISGDVTGTPVILIVGLVVAALTMVFGITWLISNIRLSADVVKQAEIQQVTEQTRTEFYERWEPVLGPEAARDLLAGVTTPTVQQKADNPSLTDDLKTALGTTVSWLPIAIIGLAGLAAWQYLPKPRRAA